MTTLESTRAAGPSGVWSREPGPARAASPQSALGARGFDGETLRAGGGSSPDVFETRTSGAGARPAGTIARPTASLGPVSFRPIEGTESPNGRYALAWGFPESNLDWTSYRDDDGTFSADEGIGVQNFLVDLGTGQAVLRTGGEHFGDRAQYNHALSQPAWSPSSRVLVELNQRKWSTADSHVVIVDRGRAFGPVDVLTPVTNAVIAKAREMNEPSVLRHGDHLAYSLFNVKVEDDGTVKCRVSGEVPRLEDEDSYFESEVTLRASPRSDGSVDLKVVRVSLADRS